MRAKRAEIIAAPGLGGEPTKRKGANVRPLPPIDADDLRIGDFLEEPSGQVTLMFGGGT